MVIWIQKLSLAVTMLVLFLVIVIPAFHILNHPSKSDAGVQAYVSMFPPLESNNAEAQLTSFNIAPDGSATMLPAKDVTVRGYLIGTTVRIIYLGGRDDAQLTSLDIFLYQSGALALHQMHPKPALNQQYTFQNIGNPGPDEIAVLGTFEDKSQQVLLTASV